MTPAVNLACITLMKTGIVTSLFGLIIMLLSNVNELLHLKILILSLSLSPKLSIQYWSTTSPQTVSVQPESMIAMLKVSASKESVASSKNIISLVSYSQKLY